MKPGNIVKLIFFLAVIACASLAFIHYTYNVKTVYFSYRLNYCIIPNQVEEAMPSAKNEHLKFFQKDFSLIIIDIHNDASRPVEELQMRPDFEGYYQNRSEEKPVLRLLKDKVSLKDIPPKSYHKLYIWTDEDIGESDIQGLKFSYRGGNRIPAQDYICISDGFYYWLLENQAVYQYIIAPLVLILVFLTGVLVGNWRGVSINLNN